MNRIIAVSILVLCANFAGAQTRRTFKDIDRDLKQVKSTATVMELISAISEAEPQTDEDVLILGDMMDKYPVEGQKAAMRIKDPKLAKAVMKEFERQAAKTKVVRGRKTPELTDKDRREYLSGYMNGAALIASLGRLQDKSAIPMLRNYLRDEDFSGAASLALGRLGDTESMETMVKGIGTGAPIDLSGYGDKGLVRVVEELDKPGLDIKRKSALVEQIKGSPSPERKRMLKDLALKHKDARVRDRSALALLNSIMVNKEPGDQAFISEWVGKTKNDETGYWAVTSIRVSHGTNNAPLDPGMTAVLIDVLRTSNRASTRQEAAQTLGMFKAKEALPYFEECAEKDKDSTVRGECQHGYWAITGKIPKRFHPKDIAELEQYYSSPETLAYLRNKTETDPVAGYGFALKRAIEEYRKNQGK